MWMPWHRVSVVYFGSFLLSTHLCNLSNNNANANKSQFNYIEMLFALYDKYDGKDHVTLIVKLSCLRFCLIAIEIIRQFFRYPAAATVLPSSMFASLLIVRDWNDGRVFRFNDENRMMLMTTVPRVFAISRLWNPIQRQIVDAQKTVAIFVWKNRNIRGKRKEKTVKTNNFRANKILSNYNMMALVMTPYRLPAVLCEKRKSMLCDTWNHFKSNGITEVCSYQIA